MATEDLWGDLPKVKGELRTPYIILKEQAELLKEKTEGLLVGEVKKLPTDDFCYRFKIVAPTINNYTFYLFDIRHDIGFYPLVLVDSQKGAEILCEDENQFKEELKAMFRSEETLDVIDKLLRHVKAEELDDMPF